jgi:hypothetical protein
MCFYFYCFPVPGATFLMVLCQFWSGRRGPAMAFGGRRAAHHPRPPAVRPPAARSTSGSGTRAAPPWTSSPGYDGITAYILSSFTLAHTFTHNSSDGFCVERKENVVFQSNGPICTASSPLSKNAGAWTRQGISIHVCFISADLHQLKIAIYSALLLFL